MQVVPFSARQARSHYRHELGTLTYVTLDEANGGIIRNLNRDGVAVQAVAPLRELQDIRVRFELRFPRLRVDARGKVCWSTRSGQCGIRFVDLAPRMGHQIDEWIFSNLLDALARDQNNLENAGLRLSPAPHPAIRIDPVPSDRHLTDPQLNWLSRPLSGRALTWLVDGLAVLAGVLLFTLIFLSIAHELPSWPLTLAAFCGAVVFITGVYWSLFAVFGGPSLGARLAEVAGTFEEENPDNTTERLR